MPRRFGVGEEVMARWPKTNLYYKGTIVDFNDIEYLVRFENSDESELAVKYRDVQGSVSFKFKFKFITIIIT